MSIVILALAANAAVWSQNPPLQIDVGGETSLVLDHVDASFATLAMVACNSTEKTWGPADLNLATANTLYGPNGTCVISLEQAGALTISGQDPITEGEFELTLDLPTLAWDCGAGISGGPDQTNPDRFAVDLLAPGWTTPTELGVQAGTFISLDNTWTHHDTVQARVLANAHIYADLDDDGRVSATERALGPVCTLTNP